MRTVLSVLSLVTVAAMLATAQSKPPAAPPSTPSDYILVDDMLLLPEQLEGGDRNRTQAYPVDYRARLGTWDFGVVPYEIAEAFSPAERQRVLDKLAQWAQVAPLRFVPRTSQSGYLNITRDAALPTQASACFSGIGQPRRAFVVRTNIGPNCQSNHTVAHELGHALGFFHEHQRSDRDNYISIDFSNVRADAVGNFNIGSGRPLVGEYDFGSIMHYPRSSFAIDTTKPTIVPHAPYQDWSARMGTLPDPSEIDHAAMAFLYDQQLRESTLRTPTEPVRTRFDRADLLLAMERLHAFYMSRFGLNRPDGLSIGGRPDFIGIAQWIFDIYVAARSGGFSAEGAFDIVVAAITRSEEWRAKNPGRTPLTPAAFTPAIAFNRDEFLEALLRLDRFYAAPEGLQRPNGLAIAGGPDFLGIAAWIFDVYLNQRLTGATPTSAWIVTENAIRASEEWRRLH
jgi:hypothetical protein